MRLEPAAPAPPPRGVRVVVDARPIQEPERSPLTASYLEHLLRAFAAEPIPDESFVLVSRSMRPDPADELAAAGLPVAASRRIPPTTRALRSAGLTLDSFLLRGAELGAAGREGTAGFPPAGGGGAGSAARRGPDLLPHGGRSRASGVATACRRHHPRPRAVGAAADLCGK